MLVFTYDEVVTTTSISCQDKCTFSIEQTLSTDNNYEYVIIENQKYAIDSTSFSEPYFNELYQSIVQEITFNINDLPTKYHNHYEKITLLHNRQRTIKKIIAKFT